MLLIHLLKCLVQPKKRSLSWLGTIAEQRDAIADLIEDSLSLRTYPAEIVDRCYPVARRNAARQMRLPIGDFPERSPFEPKAVLDPDWLP